MAKSKNEQQEREQVSFLSQRRTTKEIQEILSSDTQMSNLFYAKIEEIFKNREMQGVKLLHFLFGSSGKNVYSLDEILEVQRIIKIFQYRFMLHICTLFNIEDNLFNSLKNFKHRSVMAYHDLIHFVVSYYMKQHNMRKSNIPSYFKEGNYNFDSFEEECMALFFCRLWPGGVLPQIVSDNKKRIDFKKTIFLKKYKTITIEDIDQVFSLPTITSEKDFTDLYVKICSFIIMGLYEEDVMHTAQESQESIFYKKQLLDVFVENPPEEIKTFCSFYWANVENPKVLCRLFIDIGANI